MHKAMRNFEQLTKGVLTFGKPKGKALDLTGSVSSIKQEHGHRNCGVLCP